DSEDQLAKFRSNLKRLNHVGGDTIERMHDSDFEDSSELCETLARVVKTLVESDSAPASVDLQFFEPLTDGILVGFYPERTQSELTQEIVSAINAFQERQKKRQE
ncbi:MAG: hypothetical protein OXR03_17775, partial [Rhodospirillaceae bacterium]|nr:hypothetical protein [Rhodospirillaceae bacterium]